MNDSDVPSPGQPDVSASAGSDAGEQAVLKDRRSRDPEKWIHRPMDKYRKGKSVMEFRPDADFFALADEVVRSGRTLLGYDRLYMFWQAIRNLTSVPGSVAEIGSFRGGSAFFIAGAFQSVTGEEVPVRVFDTFEGHPAAALSHQDAFHTPGQFNDTNFDDVKAYLSRFTRMHIHRGDILLALPHLEEDNYRLVHIDTDLYLPTKACLEYFAPRLSPGAVVVLDDYASSKCPGVRAALLEHLERHDGYQVWDLRTEQLMLVKR